MSKVDEQTDLVKETELENLKDGDVKETKPSKEIFVDTKSLKAELILVDNELLELDARRKGIREEIQKIEPAPKSVSPVKPDFPYKESDNRPKFFTIWSPFNRYLPSTIYHDTLSAEAAAVIAAENNPGTDWYVMTAGKFVYKAKGPPVQKDTI